MEEMHADGIHDGEMYRWEEFCIECSNMVEMALDHYQISLERG